MSDYQDKLDFLIEKLNYWTEDRKNEFYGCPPPNKKYGEGWHHIWEDTELGLLHINKKYERTSIEVILYGNDNRFYSINNVFGPNDWNILREVYVAGTLYEDFNFEVPVYHDVVSINEVDWSFDVTMPPWGTFGNDPWQDFLSDSTNPQFLETLIIQTAKVAKTIYSVTQKYGEGMSQQVFCGATRWKNERGYYFRVPGLYTQTYDEAMSCGIASLKVINLKKFNVLKSMYNANPIIDNPNIDPVIALAKEHWAL